MAELRFGALDGHYCFVQPSGYARIQSQSFYQASLKSENEVVEINKSVTARHPIENLIHFKGSQRLVGLNDDQCSLGLFQAAVRQLPDSTAVPDFLRQLGKPTITGSPPIQSRRKRARLRQVPLDRFVERDSH